jgi:nucleotide-binding universal stress UspA family protein
MTEMRRILCPIDFSETSRHALAHAVEVAAWYGSTITALHVRTHTFTPPIVMVAFADTASGTAADHAPQDTLRLWLEPAERAGVATNILIDDGNPASHILHRSTTESTDLIVMGTHGLGGFERFVLGSVSPNACCARRAAPC